MDEMTGKRTKIWAHRGASGYAPENTMEAFRMAVEMKADGVELDVQLSRDGQLVVIHDERLDRVSGVPGSVRDLTLAQLRELNVSRPCPDFGPTRIPTLAEVLEEMKGTGLKVNIELKTGIYFYPGIEEKTAKLVASMELEKSVWFSSFNHLSVMKLQSLCPNARTAFLVSDVLVDSASYAKKYGVDALHPAVWHMQDEALIARCHEKGIAVNLWTVNDRDDMKKFCLWGADAIITNYPDVGREAVDFAGRGVWTAAPSPLVEGS